MTSHLKKNKNITIVTGGTGRFGRMLKAKNYKNFIYPNKKNLNITKLSSIENYIKKSKPKMLIHLAGLSRPLKNHETNPSKSILLNIIGTCNLVVVCRKYNIKLIYFSTSYVYPGLTGNYKETDPVLPNNNYAWSKLGGEAAVHHRAAAQREREGLGDAHRHVGREERAGGARHSRAAGRAGHQPERQGAATSQNPQAE